MERQAFGTSRHHFHVVAHLYSRNPNRWKGHDARYGQYPRRADVTAKLPRPGPCDNREHPESSWDSYRCPVCRDIYRGLPRQVLCYGWVRSASTARRPLTVTPRICQTSLCGMLIRASYSSSITTRLIPNGDHPGSGLLTTAFLLLPVSSAPPIQIPLR